MISRTDLKKASLKRRVFFRNKTSLKKYTFLNEELTLICVVAFQIVKWVIAKAQPLSSAFY